MLPSIGNLTEGKIPGTLSIPIFGQKKRTIMKKNKLRENKKTGNLGRKFLR